MSFCRYPLLVKNVCGIDFGIHSDFAVLLASESEMAHTSLSGRKAQIATLLTNTSTV